MWYNCREIVFWSYLMEFLHEIIHHVGHPFIETLKMVPILFLAYLFMEWLEHTSSNKLTSFVKKSRTVGPALGGLLGLIPQCGFSGAIAGMYAAGTVTVGTLLAVILATSDEMLPMMVSARLPITFVLVVLVLKFVVGAVTGFTADGILRFLRREQEEHIHEFCEQENCSCKDGVWLSAIKHTLKIALIIFVISVILHNIVELVPREALVTLLNFPVLSQIAASLFGLIPSCAVSVTLTQLYIDGVLGAGPLLCGLMTNGGVGLLVLYRVNRNLKSNLIITLTVFLVGLAAGSLAGIFF